MFVRLSMLMSMSVGSVGASTCLSVFLLVRPFVCLSSHLSVSVFRPSMHEDVHVCGTGRYFCLFLGRLVWLSVYPVD